MTKTKKGRPPLLEIKCKACGELIIFSDIEEKREYFKNKELCPNCGSLYSYKPETERILFYLQDEYFDLHRTFTRDELEENRESYKVLDQIYLIVKDYAFSLLCYSYKSRLHSQEDIEYYSAKSASYLIESYLRPLRCKNKEEGKNECGYEWYPDKLVDDYTKLRCPECGELFIGENSYGNLNKGRTHYSVWGSFKGALLSRGTGIIPYALSGKDEKSVFSNTNNDNIKYKIKKISDVKNRDVVDSYVFNNDLENVWVSQKKNIPNIESLNFTLSDGNEVQYADAKNDLLKEIEEREDVLNTAKYFTNLIMEAKEYCQSPEENLMRLLGVYYRLKRGEFSADNLFKMYNRLGKESYEKTMNVLKKELIKSRQCFYEQK